MNKEEINEWMERMEERVGEMEQRLSKLEKTDFEKIADYVQDD